MELEVGQIIFLLANKEAKVFPALVSEQINKKTLKGDETSYVVMLPDKDSSCVELSRVDAEIFKSIDDARSEMVERATTQNNKILDHAITISDRFSQHTDTEDDVEALEEENPVHARNENVVKISLGDGVVGNLDMSTLPG